MFSGEIKEGSNTWLYFESAMHLIPEIHKNHMNYSDAIAQLRRRLKAPAKLCISVSDMYASVTTIIGKLKKIYGRPEKVLNKIIQQHHTAGTIYDGGNINIKFKQS